MDSEKKVLICGCADDVCCKKKRERKYRGVPQSDSTEELECDDCNDAVFGPWLGSAELQDLYFMSQQSCLDRLITNTSG